MSKLRSVVVGTGGWAEAHLRAYAQCTEIEPVGIWGRCNTDRLDELTAKYDIPERSLVLGQLLDSTQPDIVDIACNPHFRLVPVQAAMQASVKLINCEKPLALAPSEAYEIERLCLEHGKPLTVNHQCKLLPGWLRAKDAIASGAIGDIAFMRATCQGNLLEQGTHLIDMVMHFNDYNPLSWVIGQVDALEGFDKEAAGAPDAAVATLGFDNGVRAEMAFGTLGYEIPEPSGSKWYKFAVEVYGTQGHVNVTLNHTVAVTTYADGKTVVEESSWDRSVTDALAAHLDSVARYARDASLGHISDLPKSMASFDAIMAIYASAAGGGIIELPQRFDDGLVARLQERTA